MIAHGGLVVNGQPYRFTRYTWNKTDSVVERIYPDGKFDHGIDIASFGPGLNMQNVYGCYLSPHVRKVKSGGWFPEYTSSLDDYANMYEALFLRLKRYQTMKPSCKIVIRIYEGENANEANRSYAETDNVFEKWPIRDEEEYK